ncbi:type II and III secretion system protein [Vibrio kanaloae]|uniref:Type II and III secretion system protein n=1 Tax=Vibrio kanaloae TaxID=170673 RepID=A0A4U1Z3E0_9VIBR|nr:type II and III secretion system protein [Vibrio kanaloae]TKF26767.1 type II and III secretion system protein [Vibrio kanaloae]
MRVSTPASGLPLSMVLSDVLSPFDKHAWFGAGVSPNTRVRIQHDGSLSALLNDIERQLNVGFTPKGDTLNVERFVSRTFELELPPGMLSDQIGSGENSEGSSDEEASAKMDGQYVTLSSSDVDVFGEVALGVESLLQLDPDLTGEGDTQESLVGSVQAVPSLSRLVVRTTPGRMREVVEFVEQSKQSLTRQVALEVQVLEFRSNLGHDRGIDWNIVRDIGDNSLSFFIPGTSLVSGSSSPGFAFTGGGKWSGSTALINALNQQGQVSTETPITILVQNHQTNHITQERIIEFVENISSDSDEGVITTDTERGKRSEGVDFIVVPNIQRDHVYLRTSGMLTKIESLETQEVGGETLVFPQMREAKINFANKLKYGQTIVVASVSQIDTTTEESTFLGIPFLGGNSAVKQRVDTLVLLTPRRADG